MSSIPSDTTIKTSWIVNSYGRLPIFRRAKVTIVHGRNQTTGKTSRSEWAHFWLDGKGYKPDHRGTSGTPWTGRRPGAQYPLPTASPSYLRDGVLSESITVSKWTPGTIVLYHVVWSRANRRHQYDDRSLWPVAASLYATNRLCWSLRCGLPFCSEQDGGPNILQIC